MRRLPSLRSLRWFAALALAGLVSGCGGGATATRTATTTTTAALGGTPSSAEALQRRYVAVVQQVEPEVVQIQTDGGLGSGVILDSRGDIVTNAHVVAGATRLRVTLADGRGFPGRLLGSYPPDDLAVVRIGAQSGLRAATFADSSRVQVGDLVLAVGNPLGLQSSVTDGIVSGVNRDVSEGQGVVLPGAIQTSAPINPGNSGGALADLQGQIIGIPTVVATNPQIGGSAAGIGFAVPSNLVKDIAGQIVRHGRVVNSHRAALGITLSDSTAGTGAVIVAVHPGGPAARSGMRVGDTIEAIDGRSITGSEGLIATLAALAPGQRVTITVRRPDGSTARHTVRLGQLAGS